MATRDNVVIRSIVAGAICALASFAADAQLTVSDNFTGATNTLSWQVLGSACLTAGTNTSSSSGQIIKCTPSGDGGQNGGFGNTTHPGGYLAAGVKDPVGNGALRLTNSTGNDSGAVIYQSSFPSTQGIAITFTAVSYDGDSGGGVSDGADGLGFFLLDSRYTPAIGSFGGSLGYSCSNSNSPYKGQSGAYLGLGIDEYGNFLNNSDNTATGTYIQDTSTLAFATSGSQYQGNRIGLRGAGDINWTELNINFPNYYPSSLSSSQQQSAVQSTCQTGTLWDYSSGSGSNTGNVANFTWSQLHTINATYYPSSLSSSNQTAAVNNTNQTGTLWNYSSLPGTNTAATVSPLMYTWSQLHSLNSTYYPSTLSSSNQTAAVNNTNSTGTFWNYSSLPGTNTAKPITPILRDYVPIAGGSLALPTTTLIANESAGARNNATSRTYNLKITSAGLLTLAYAPNDPVTGVPGNAVPVLTNQSITAANGPLPTSFVFGFSAGTGGSNNIHEITCFQAAPADTSDSSAGINVVQTGQVRTGTSIYLAYYHTHDWWGQLTAQNLVYNTTTNSLTIQATSTWDSACVLTGDTAGAAGSTLTGGTTAGSCGATGNLTSDTAEAWLISSSSRQMLTSSGGAGIAFEYASLTATQQGWLNAGDSLGSKRVSYLRGDRSNENTVANNTGPFRARISVLGDIVDSSPTWVGGPSAPYPSSAGTSVTVWGDLLYPTVTMPENSSTYGNFQSSNSSRLNVVYVGANDGFMHGFEAGYGSSTTTASSNDGKEVIAYMPNAVLNTIHNSSNTNLDYSGQYYSRNYYVDATPEIGDLYYGGAWHTWLVSGLGAGGNAIFALDVTKPTNFTEGNASTLVKGEWDTSTGSLGNDLGQTYGTPQIRRFHNGQWGFVFGNGYNSTNGVAGIFIGLVDSTSGAVTFSFLSTGVGGSSSKNGIFTPEVVDLDGDHVADYIYAGDLQGNVWRWDVTSNNSSTWASTTPIQIFAAGSTQPITSQVQVLSTPNPGGLPRIMVAFGTGSQTQTVSAVSYAAGQQSLYGIWDGNTTTWNSLSANVNQYDPYPTSFATTYPGGTINSTTYLQSQSITTATAGTTTNCANDSGIAAGTTTATGCALQVTGGSALPYRATSNNAICWVDLNNCTSPQLNNQYGWIFQLPAASTCSSVGEQVVFNPIVQNGAFVVNTYVPACSTACVTNPATGWTMAINPINGGSFTQTFFVNPSSVNETGVQFGGTGSPSLVNANSQDYLVTQTSNGGSSNSAITAQVQYPGGMALRLNWSELR